jgi:anaphase-promoting complex subunit 11
MREYTTTIPLTPTALPSTDTGGGHETNISQTSRKRRNETTEFPVLTNPLQENENLKNPSIPKTSSSSAAARTNISNDHSNQAMSVVPTNNIALSDTENLTTKVQVKVRIQRFHSVAHWTWGSNTKDDVCSICQNAFEGVCPGVKYPGEDCPVVWGKCQHAFHLQCINTWLTSNTTTNTSSNTKNSCPICRQEWEFSSSNPTSTTGTSATRL